MTTFVIYQDRRKVGQVLAESAADALSVFRRPGAPPSIQLQAYSLRHVNTRRPRG